MGLRRNAVDYAESMWRRHGDLVHMVVGPPGSSRDVWWLHHPDGAARVLSGSSWRAYAKHDQVHDEIGRWLGPGLLTAEGEDWTRQKRFVQPVFTKVGRRGLRRPHGRRDRDGRRRVGRHRPADVVDLGEQMQRLTLRVVLKALFGDSADDVVPPRAARPSRSSPTPIMRRGLGACGCPPASRPRRVRRGRAAREPTSSACATTSSRARREGARPARPTCSAGCSPRATATSGSSDERCAARCSSSCSPGTRPPRPR